MDEILSHIRSDFLRNVLAGGRYTTHLNGTPGIMFTYKSRTLFLIDYRHTFTLILGSIFQRESHPFNYDDEDYYLERYLNGHIYPGLAREYDYYILFLGRTDKHDILFNPGSITIHKKLGLNAGVIMKDIECKLIYRFETVEQYIEKVESVMELMLSDPDNINMETFTRLMTRSTKSARF
jgi:hypothetical protein